MTTSAPPRPSAPQLCDLVATAVQNGGRHSNLIKKIYVENTYGVPDLLARIGTPVLAELQKRGVKVFSVGPACNRCVTWGFSVRHSGDHDEHALLFFIYVDSPITAEVVVGPPPDPVTQQPSVSNVMKFEEKKCSVM